MDKYVLRGFTLIELLVVVSILGVLSVLGLNSFSASQKKGWDAKRTGDLVSLQQALEMYYNDYGKYPAASSGNMVACGGSQCTWGGGPMSDASGTVYMRVVPKDPRSPLRTYYYTAAGDRSWYKVYSCIEYDQDVRRKIGGYAGTNCGNCIETTTTVCNYGISSPNTTP